MGNFVESLVPGNTFKRGFTRPFRLYPSHGIQHAIRRVHAVQILGDFCAKESVGNGVLGIALNFGGAAIFDGDQDAAGIRAVVRAGSVDNALHARIIGIISPAGHRDTEKNSQPFAQNKKAASFGRPVSGVTSKLPAIVRSAVPAPGPPPQPACRWRDS